ncbi:uncharacterized protein ACLA_020570 [Aspergillus clavatus NRRL 1]|uniref:Uncharacterized protein n=1 Tax=Aspergillus clavatus (strain ATCC 1007 / CBS 513.65 / DSM 816 / NCTC 3887 / NRRL 1 / QM 1276 / 107) TaxID=344612 RepID=A1CNX9_ASPCL|nr:uncharacterized protein ACLA_020570 [Aspergillus clavatus NRRL 1]EAW07350.1 conserved hypothetical protein [Aspergillus clavatus NRRL 1]
MYTYTPTAKFLVLSPLQRTPLNKFLVLSPTESGPEQYESSPSSASSTGASHVRDRSDSQSSTSSDSSETGSTFSLDGNFLYLGHRARPKPIVPVDAGMNQTNDTPPPAQHKFINLSPM